MKLTFDKKIAINYKSNSQRVRILSEDWVKKAIFCPNCGKVNIDQYPNNRPVADFYCTNCKEDFELKSKQDNLGAKIVDGAYSTMIKRLNDSNNPNFFLLSYNLKNLEVVDFLVMPKHFFTSRIIEKRKPLAIGAKRAGWVGCNILLKSIPSSGKVFYIKNQQMQPKEKIISEWRKTLFLREENKPSEKGWLLDIMRLIEKLDKKEFILTDIYAFESELGNLHPNNKHVKDKIRQQLQILRDKGYIDFISRGRYRIS